MLTLKINTSTSVYSTNVLFTTGILCELNIKITPSQPAQDLHQCYDKDQDQDVLVATTKSSISDVHKYYMLYKHACS